MKPILLLPLLMLPLCGCTYLKGKQTKLETSAVANDLKVSEESKALTTAIVDVLAVAPTNQHTGLALGLARNDQQLEGIPVKRIDVEAILAGQQAAIKELQGRYRLQENLLEEKSALAIKLREAENRLIELGKAAETAKNRSVLKRLWSYIAGTLGLGGFIALCILFPAIIPLLGSLISWLVGKVPALAGYFGVVGKKAFDSVVIGVGKVRNTLKKQNANEMLELMNTELHKATDEDHRKLISHRKLAAGL